MVKTSGFKKTLAILLSVLLAVPMFVLPTFADGDPVFHRVYTSSSYYESGETWYNCKALADATDTAAYKSAYFYLSEDEDILKIEYTVDGETTTELHERNTESLYFDYLCVVPAFGDPLPTSPDGLEDGDYWFDQAGLVSLLQTAGGNEQTLYAFENATFRLSVDETMLRMTCPVQNSEVTYYQDELLAEPEVLCNYLFQIGVDPNEGFTLLPTSDEGLEDGDYWFDLASFLDTLSESNRPIYQSAQYYVSDDGKTLRIVVGMSFDVTEETEPTIFRYLCQVGVDPNAGFNLLPTSDEGLADGDYWYDVDALIASIGNEETVRAIQFYLSEDETTLRMISSSFQYNFTRDDEEGATFFAYLRQVGVDPDLIEGFTRLPISDEGLEDGDYWFDVEGFAALIDDESTQALYRTAKFYLSDDHNTLRFVIAGQSQSITRDNEDTSIYFSYLHQVGVDPHYIPGFIQLPVSDDGLEEGAYWFDAASFAEVINHEEYLTYLYYLSEDGNTLRIMIDGYAFDVAKDSDGSNVYFQYLRQVGVDPYPGYTVLPKSDEGLETGAYWFDAAGFAAMANDESYLSAKYMLSDDGNTLHITVGGYPFEIHKDSGGASTYFVYLHKVGEVYTQLPVSDEGLEDGDYWFDAAGFAQAIEDESYLTATYSLNADAGILCVTCNGETQYYMDDAENAVFFRFLRQKGVDPNEGFDLLPTTPDGLDDGDYWYDAAGLAVLIEDEEFLDAEYYLSEDGTTLRVVLGGETMDLTQETEEGVIFFGYLRQVGVDPNAGFIPLPTSNEGLEIGDWWFDAAGFAVDQEDDGFLTSEYYLSEDGSTLRIVFFGFPIDTTLEDPDGEEIFAFLHQVTLDADTTSLTMSAPADPIYTGDTVVVTVDLTQNAGLAGMSLTLQYDADVLTLTDVQTAGMLQMGNVTIGGDMNAQPFNILWDDATAHDNHTETGTILTLTFTVKDSAAAGNTAVTLTYDADSTFDVDLQNVPLTISGTTVSIIRHLPGDVNGDGEVNLQDVVILTRYLAGGWDVTIDLRNSDVNGDGIYDLKDVVLIRRFLAGGWDVTLI